jgi:hypothetical protein
MESHNSGWQDQTNPVDDPGNQIFRQTYIAINKSLARV